MAMILRSAHNSIGYTKVTGEITYTMKPLDEHKQTRQIKNKKTQEHWKVELVSQRWSVKDLWWVTNTTTLPCLPKFTLVAICPFPSSSLTQGASSLVVWSLETDTRYLPSSGSQEIPCTGPKWPLGAGRGCQSSKSLNWSDPPSGVAVVEPCIDLCHKWRAPW